MDKPKVIIIGSQGHAKVVIDIFEKENKYQIIGLIDAFRENGEETLGYKVLGNEEDLPELLQKHPGCEVFIAIGDNWVRYKEMMKVKEFVHNVKFATTIHPSAQLGKNVKVGIGVAIMPGVIINSDSIIGDFAVVNTKSSMGHDSKMHNFSSLAPDVTTGGNVTIGEFSAISIGAIIKHGISVGSHTVVGAGALLMKNCGDNIVIYGIPATTIRKREIGEKYL